MAQSNYRNCWACRIMRSMAFSGLGAALGAGGAFLLGFGKQEAMMSALALAAIFAFGLTNKRK